MLQYLDPELNSVEEVVLFEAGAGGDKVIIPPNRGGLVIINPANETLVTANWVADGFSSSSELLLS